MKIQIKLFAYLKDRFGQSVLELDLPEASTASALFQKLETDYPEAKEALVASRLAVNQTYLQDLNTPIQTGDELALIPPVSGG